MGLKVIGSGFGRTGTMTAKDALTMLGFGPCHHMFEVMQNPKQLPFWKALAAGDKVEWADVFEEYTSQVDWPGAHVWHETSIAFPDAKVIHTERPEDDWWNSFNGTIGKSFARRSELGLPPHIDEIFQTMSGWFLKETFTDFTDRTAAIAAYRCNNEKVRDTIPADRLLVYNVAEGWDPLCRFLEVPVPSTPFPHHNIRQEFWQHFGGEPA